jgi:kynureninase
MQFEFNVEYARAQDQADPLKRFRDEFHIPMINGKPAVYFTGNSLGLQPKKTQHYLNEELEDWKNHGVEGHFHAKRPWMPYHEFFTESLSKIAGANPKEVVAMGTLTNNLHLLMVSFYRPTEKRYKILCEAKAFPSDRYALASQVRFHGYKEDDAVIALEPRDGEHTLRHEDVLKAIENNKDELALVMIGGVNFYTGQVMKMKEITSAGHAAGALVGWDLAHAFGNVPLDLHDWNVDFAAWCTYKYLNAGPGAIAGIFVHEKHLGQTDIPRFEGWWGHEKETRFEMPNTFVPIKSAEAWQLSNAPVFSMAPQRASLDLFDQTSIAELREKSIKLSGYLEYVLNYVAKKNQCDFEIITPLSWEERGAQVSVLLHGQGRPLFDKLMEEGVIADWREPNVIRMAPVPMYCNFEDIFRFGQILLDATIKT